MVVGIEARRVDGKETLCFLLGDGLLAGGGAAAGGAAAGGAAAGGTGADFFLR